MKKLSNIFMPALNKNSGMAAKNLEYYRYFLYLCTSKGKKLCISAIALLFTAMQLSGQENTRYGVGILGSYSDAAEMTTELLPSYHYAAVKSRNVWSGGNTEKQEQTVSLVASLNNSLAVGATAGIADVTATGGASYQIPIEVPNGIAGLEPSVAVSYNSQNGYGLAGYGWNLTASSTITRCGKTYYYDNAADAPQLYNTDNLMLDGQRLILVSGSNLASGAKYRMEFDPSTDVVYKSVGSYNGHTIDSKAFGLFYLFAIGIPSGISAWKDRINNTDNHDSFWTETRANRRATKYFGKHYGVNWDTFISDYPL
jgi:hypothetical protein